MQFKKTLWISVLMVFFLFSYVNAASIDKEDIGIKTLFYDIEDCKEVNFNVIVENRGRERVEFFIELLNGKMDIEHTSELFNLDSGDFNLIQLKANLDKIEKEKTYEFLIHFDNQQKSEFKTVDLSECTNTIPIPVKEESNVKSNSENVKTYPFIVLFSISLIFVVLILVIVFIIINYLEEKA